MRAVEEWIGKTDDARVPARVRLRVFEKHGGKCYLTGRKIMPGDKWELEHVQALCNDGKHRESNLAPVLAGPHKIKTKADRATKKKSDRIRKRHNGILRPRSITRWRNFRGEIVVAPRER